jgi:hypothetical protein
MNALFATVAPSAVEQGGDFKNPRGLLSPFYRGVAGVGNAFSSKKF